MFNQEKKQGTLPKVTAPQVQQAPVVPAQPTHPKPFVEYVIIGGGTASYYAMETIKSQDPEAHVLIVSDQQFVPYQRPPLSKELWFDGASSKDYTFMDWQGNHSSVFYLPRGISINKDAYHQVNLKTLELSGSKVNFLANTKVDKIDTESKFINVNGKKIHYSKVLIATGGSPRTLGAVEQLDTESKKKVTTFRGLEDYAKLEAIASSDKTIAVIGGGFLGSELAVALAQKQKLGAKIVQVFPEKGNIGLVLPTFLSKWTTGRLIKEGIDVRPDSQVTGLSADDETGKIKIHLKEKESIEADHVVVAVGLKPNTELAQASGLELDPSLGGIVVNAELEARSDVFAAGDVTSYHDIALGRRRVEHYDHAVESGKLAGLNMTGAQKPYTHQSMFWSNLGPEVNFEAVGVLDAKLPTVSVWAKQDKSDEQERHDKGVVYYLDKQKKVVGVLLWNIHNQLDTARGLIKSGKVFNDPNQLSGFIKVHQE